MKKSEDTFDFNTNTNGIEVSVLKVQPDEKRVFGIFSLIDKNGEVVIDKHDDVIATKDLEEAAYQFVLKARVAGHNHTKMGVGTLIESMVFTREKMAHLKKTLEDAGVKDPQLNIDAEFWYGGFQVEDDTIWDMIKSGEILSFSIGGKALRSKIG